MRRLLIAVTAAAAFFAASVPSGFAVASENANCNGQLTSTFATTQPPGAVGEFASMLGKDNGELARLFAQAPRDTCMP